MKKIYLLFVFLMSFAAITQSQNALDFDGTNDYITVPNASNLIANKNLSISFWVYPENTSPSFPNFDGIAGFRNNSNADFYILQLSATSVEARFRNSSNTNYDIVYSGLVLNDWNHFVFTYNSSTLTLYHNGVSVGTQSASGSITNTTEAFYIGNLLFQTTNFYLDGKMDDVALWSKSLSASEVTALYNNCNIDINASGLELAYEFNQGTGNGSNTSITSATDSKGNINGTLNNFSLTGTSSNFIPYSQNAFSNVSASTCNGSYVSPTGNHVWTTSGTYYDTIATGSVNGCDSIIIVNLLVGSASNTTTLNVSDCDSYTSPSGNYTWTTTGTYTDTIPSIAGCDSIITINFTNNTTTSTISPTVCGSYTAPSGDQTFTSSGTFQDIIPNHLGCDSIITINVTVNPSPDTSITQNIDMLTSGATTMGVTYQWLNCDLNFATINGATNQTFIPSNNGNYAVAVDLNGCVDTSFCYNVFQVSTINTFKSKVQIYPNPAIESIQIDLGESYSDVSIQLLNIQGQVVRDWNFNALEKTTLDLNELSGVYFLDIRSGGQRKVEKIIVTGL